MGAGWSRAVMDAIHVSSNPSSRAELEPACSDQLKNEHTYWQIPSFTRIVNPDFAGTSKAVSAP
jgi:hypothetical protein